MSENEEFENTKAIWIGLIGFLVSIIYFLFNWDIFTDIDVLILGEKNKKFLFSQSVWMVIIFIVSILLILQNFPYSKKKGWRKFIINSIYLFISICLVVLLFWLIWHFWIGKTI